MVLIALAATLPVNPSGSSMILTHSDVWSGLIEKCLRPHTGFVKPIVDCKVNEHARTVIDRTVTFEKGFTMGKEDEEAGVHERVELVEGYSVSLIPDTVASVARMRLVLLALVSSSFLLAPPRYHAHSPRRRRAAVQPTTAAVRHDVSRIIRAPAISPDREQHRLTHGDSASSSKIAAPKS